MNPRDAFSGQRFEYDAEHLYYLPPWVMSVLEASKPVYVIGSRGAGKTTLLKALHWKERLHNSSLSDQLGDTAFEGKYIGVYLKLPEIQLAVLTRAYQDVDSYCNLLSVYLDLLVGELMLEAVAEMSADGQWLSIDVESESASVSQFLEKYKEKFLRYLPRSRPRSFEQLRVAFQDMHLDLIREARVRASERQLVETFPIGQVGELGRDLADAIAAGCRSPSGASGHWCFKACLDEGECLELKELEALNTMVRLSRLPLTFVIAFLDQPQDIVSTTFGALRLSRDDRVVLHLDEMEDSFREFAEGVARMRVQYCLGDSRVDFRVAEILGSLDLNATLARMLTGTTSKRARALLKRAAELAGAPFFRDEATSETGSTRALPIYQAYLVEELQLSLPEPHLPSWERRLKESQEIRKRMVAAYIAVCRELGYKVRYCTSDMLFQLSDCCIRDFLSFLQSLLSESGMELHEFIKTRVDEVTQDRAFRAASAEKYGAFHRSGVRCANEAKQIVHGLAELTAALQSGSPDKAHLRSSERGRFKLRVPALPSRDQEETIEILVEAAEAGYLRRLSEPGEAPLRFRVHTSLAPCYGFSYRGAYYDTPLDIADVCRLRFAGGHAEVEEVVSSLKVRCAGSEDPRQPRLPLSLEDDEGRD